MRALAVAVALMASLPPTAAGQQVDQGISFEEAARVCERWISSTDRDLDWTPSAGWRRLFAPTGAEGPHFWQRNSTGSRPSGARQLMARVDVTATPSLRRRSCSVEWYFTANPEALSALRSTLQARGFMENSASQTEASGLTSWARITERSIAEVHYTIRETPYENTMDGMFVEGGLLPHTDHPKTIWSVVLTFQAVHLLADRIVHDEEERAQ